MFRARRRPACAILMTAEAGAARARQATNIANQTDKQSTTHAHTLNPNTTQDAMFQNDDGRLRYAGSAPYIVRILLACTTTFFF